MIPKKVNARDALAAIRAGLGDVALLKKFQLSSNGLQSLFDKLVDSGLITQSEIDNRSSLTDRTIALTIHRCPKCQMPQLEAFDVCPQCGVIVNKLREAAPTSKEEPGLAPRILDLPLTDAVQAPPPQLRGVEYKLHTKSQYITTPVFGDGLVCTGGSDSILSCFVDDTRIKKWIFRADGPIQGPPAIANGAVYFGTLAGTLFALFLSNGTKKFAVASYSPIYGSPCVYGNLVYFGNFDGMLYSLDAENGAEHGRISLGKPIRTGPVVRKGRVYVASEDGDIFVVT
jgi:hypothetical protein